MKRRLSTAPVHAWSSACLFLILTAALTTALVTPVSEDGPSFAKAATTASVEPAITPFVDGAATRLPESLVGAIEPIDLVSWEAAELTPKEQKKLDKLLKKLAKQEDKLAYYESKVLEWEAELVLAEAELAAALAELAITEAAYLSAQATYWAAKATPGIDKDLLKALKQTYKEKKKAWKQSKKRVKKAEKWKKKATKKIAKYEKKVDKYIAKIESTNDDIEELLNGDDDDGEPGGGGDDDDDDDDGGGDGGDDPGGGGDPDPGGGADPGGPVSIPLLVQEALPKNVNGFNRTKDIATFGMPFPQGQVEHAISGRPALGILGSDRWQFKTLDTWPDGSVKWALVDVKTAVDAGEIDTSLEIVDGGGHSGQSVLASVEDGGDRIRMDMGSLEVDIDTVDFNLFDRVLLGGVQLVNPGASDGIVGLSETGSPISVGPGCVVEIEENGPARAVVKATGTLVNGAGDAVVDFTCRITGRALNSWLEVTFTLRNANIARPSHVTLESIELDVRADVGGSTKTVTVATHDGSETLSVTGSGQDVILYQAGSSAKTLGVSGSGGGYKPHIPKETSTTLIEEGYRLVHDGTVLHGLGNEDQYPDHGWLDIAGGKGGMTIGLKQMPYFWPASLEAKGNGETRVGVFTDENSVPYTFTWRQHESRTALYAFHLGSSSPLNNIRRIDYPVSARAANYDKYDQAGVFAYELLTKSEQNAAYAAMGIPHSVNVNNENVEVTRFLPGSQTGGANNHALIEKNLAGIWLREGHGGAYLNALDLALYKSEWQIVRSDGWDHDDDPGADNDEVPHTENHEGDKEHRYREGIILAWYMTGDPRYREAIDDEVEILSTIGLSAYERSTYQSMRALAIVHEFSGDATLRDKLEERVDFLNSQTINVDSESSGWGWQGPPGSGSRRYYANSAQNTSEKPPGENFVARGFVSGSLGPLAFYHAQRVLDSGSQANVARARMRDLSYWTMNELYPFHPDPEQRKFVYSYNVTFQSINSTTGNSHPIVLGMAESFLNTGNVTYLEKGVEQLEGAYHQDSAGEANDLANIEARLDVQHFCSVYLDWAD